METKVIKPLLRSLFISYALSALFLGALAFALYKLRLGESLVNLLIFAVYFAACFAGGFSQEEKSETGVFSGDCCQECFIFSSFLLLPGLWIPGPLSRLPDLSWY